MKDHFIGFREMFGGEITCLFFSFPSIVMEILRILVLIGQILFSLAAVFLLCLVIKTYLIGPYYRKLHMESKGNKEILILGISAFIFLMLTVILKISVIYIIWFVVCLLKACDQFFLFILIIKYLNTCIFYFMQLLCYPSVLIRVKPV